MNSFLKVYLLLTITVLTLVATFNMVIDPYGIFNIVTLEGINTPKSEVQNHEKMTKAYRVIGIKPDVVALGTSRTDFGIDPRLFATHDERAYNMAMAGADIYVTRRYLEHVIAVKPITKLVLGLDFFAFNAIRGEAPDFSENYFLVRKDGSYNRSFRSKLFFSSLLSISAVRDAIRTIENANAVSTQMLDDTTGMRVFRVRGKTYDSGAISKLQPKRIENSAHRKFVESESMYLKHVYLAGSEKQYAFVDPATGRSSFNEFRKIVRLCKENHIKAYFFVSPSHARQMETIKDSGLWPLFEQWKREIIRLVENEGDSGQQVWDFSGYNSITTVDVPEIGRMREYLDSSHYTSRVGKLIVARMQGDSQPDLPKDFGLRLTSANIENVLAHHREQQALYGQKHPKTVAEIEGLAKDAGIDAGHVRISGSGWQLSAQLSKKR